MTSSGDDEREPPANGTIQVDALTDVQLVDDVLAASRAREEEEETSGDAPATSLPPPLPRKPPTTEPAPSNNGRAIALTLLAAIVGAGLAFAAVHYLFPSPTAAPTVSAPPPYTAATSATPHRVTLDDELVIHAGSGASDGTETGQ